MHTIEKKEKLDNAIRIMADEAERLGADGNDSNGAVRAIVTSAGLSFCAWFCVCAELADRSARKEGFKDQTDRALANVKFKSRKAAP